MAGRTQINELASQNIVALCDVDWREYQQRPGPGAERAAVRVAKKYPSAKRFDDWRVMLQEMDKQIDGVVVNTPDHTHVHCVIAAMKMGKHVMCEKPLGHSVHETRAMMAAEKKYKKSITTRSFRAMPRRTAVPSSSGSGTARSGTCKRLTSTNTRRAAGPRATTTNQAHPGRRAGSARS